MVFICDVCESGTTDQRSMRVCEGTFLEDGTQATPPCEEYKLLCPACHCEDCEVEQDAPSVDVRVDSFSAEAQNFWGDMSVGEVIDKLMERDEFKRFKKGVKDQ